MRLQFGFTIAFFLLLSGCGGSSGDGPANAVAQPEHSGIIEAQEPSSESPRSAGLDTEPTLAPEIADAWVGIRIELIQVDTQASETYEVGIGSSEVLGDSGLILSALSFVPDFVMDEDRITSRSESADNPAARVQISDGGSFEYEGWIFAAMPGIHPHPHPMYQVVLVEGIPAG